MNHLKHPFASALGNTAKGSRLWHLAAIAGLSLSFAACDSDPGGPITPPPPKPCEETGTCPNPDDKADFGETCERHADCETGFCTTLTATSNQAFCLIRCSEQSDCAGTEEASSCTSVTTQSGGFAQACVPSDFCYDEDADGYGEGPGCVAFDCDDNDPNVHPGADELCDGVDNNCNGLVDETPVDANTPCSTQLPGECAEGRWACVLGQRFCNAMIQPDQRREICDGLDNDCDGKIDEGPDGFDTNFIQGLGMACGGGGNICFSGVTVCDPETRIISCEGENEELPDVPDLCDYIDNDCDGNIDEDVVSPNFGESCEVGIGTCRATGIVACVPNDPAATPVCNAVPNTANATPEICDYNDNDCDGLVDEGFVNAQGVYNLPTDCGSCGNNCNARWNPNPAAFGIATTCTVQGSSAKCTYTCLSNRVDLDGVQSNGCEFEPDQGAVYVAMSTNGTRPGVDNDSCGLWDTPCATIAHALTRANTNTRPRIRVSEGIFAGGFDLVNGISILGGHSARNWTREQSEGEWINNTTLQGGKTSGAHAYALKATNITLATEISGLTIEAPDAAGPSGNSIGIWIVNSNQNLSVKDNTILGGRGGVGAPGSAGTNGASGPAGSRGADRRNSQTSFSALLGGAAGAGTCSGTNVSGSPGAPVSISPDGSARAINNDATNGGAVNAPGASRVDSGSNDIPDTYYGYGGTSTWHTALGSEASGVYGCANNSGPASPTAGTNGLSGQDGSGGVGASNSSGQISAGMWSGAQGSAGASGTAGRGGGGGGSSGGAREGNSGNRRYHYGSTGGGGGAGGCQGTGATGGQAGGASFGIFATFATAPTAANRPIIQGNHITRGQGGRGGQGGLGGVGGDGGAGGLPGAHDVETGNYSRCGQPASPGGAGGRGGHGGGGGGGAGGVSFDIAVGGTVNNTLDVYQGQNTYELANGTATGGAGGPGGTSIQNAGSAGAQGAAGNFRRF